MTDVHFCHGVTILGLGSTILKLALQIFKNVGVVEINKAFVNVSYYLYLLTNEVCISDRTSAAKNPGVGISLMPTLKPR